MSFVLWSIRLSHTEDPRADSTFSNLRVFSNDITSVCLIYSAQYIETFESPWKSDTSHMRWN